MIDRMDIDALLIGALYGELTPADEARLAAHLESHPADRTALADLTRTRDAVRESRILAAQLEPPQSVSALLLQEAARRAPRARREPDGWFLRLARSFMAHPAIAAAAMFVIVLGVASTLYVRHGDDLAAPPESATAVDRAAPPVTPMPPPPAAAAPAIAQETAEAETGRVLDGSKNTAIAGAAAGSGVYDVKLEEGLFKKDKARLDQLAFRNADTTARAEPEAKEAQGRGRYAEPPKAAAPDDRGDRPNGRADERAAGKLQKPRGKSAGIELHTPELMPKELDDDKPVRSAPARRELGDSSVGALESSAKGDVAQAPSATSGAPPPPPRTVAPAPPSAGPAAQPAAPPAPEPAANENRAGKRVQVDDNKDADASVAAKKASRPAKPAKDDGAGGGARDDRRQDSAKPAPATTRPADEKPKAGEDKTLVSWARKQHDQVIALVRSNNCPAAATAAIEIYSRVPDYYTANVATDRSVKPCVAYLNSERQREDRSRALKRANTASDAPAQVDTATDRK